VGLHRHGLDHVRRGGDRGLGARPLSAVDVSSGVALAALHLMVGTILIVGRRTTTRQI
jgi:hypothetical protein